MYDALFEGTTQYLLSLWMMFFFIIACLTIFLFCIWIHYQRNRIARKMRSREAVFKNLVQSVRYGQATNEEIENTVLPGDYPYFQRYLQETINTIKPIDVSSERAIADVSGFTDYLKKRIEKTKKWDKAIAIRVLSYFRDRENLPIFKKILREETFPQAISAAGAGIALCKDTDLVREVAQRIWSVSEHNQGAVLIILNIYGEHIAPLAHDVLREGMPTNEGKIVASKFLSGLGYKEAIPTIVKMLQVETSKVVIASLLNALRYLDDESVLMDVLPFLEHKDFTLRIEALHVVARAGGITYIQHIERRLSDENWWVRRESALAMAAMGKEGISRLKILAEGENEYSRHAARGILSELQFNRISV